MTTITHGSVRFVDIPEYFLIRYAAEIDAWARNVRKIGLVKSIVLREGNQSDLSPNPEYGAQLIQVKLMCRPFRGGIEVLPLEPRDKELIAKHCEKLEAARIPAGAVLVEPPRPFIPFMPDKIA